MDSIRRSRRGRHRWRNGLAELGFLLLALSILLGTPTPISATHADRGFDVDPETEVVNAGLPVVLTAFDSDGRGDGRTVRFYFLPGSPSDTPASPDLQCVILLGTCSVSYVPTVNGTDSICATVQNQERHCDEPWDAVDGHNREDTVERMVMNGAVPAPPPLAPTPVPDRTAPPGPPSPPPPPTPAPTAVPTAVPVPNTGYPYVEAATADVAPGQLVTLSVLMLRSDGSRATRSEGDADVHFYFLPGSPNDQRTRRNEPDLRCRTGDDAWCTVSYLARNEGVDVICAHVGGRGRWETMCAESWEARDLDNGSDVVRRRIAVPVRGPTSRPDPEPEPTATPTPEPSEVLVVPVAGDRGGTSPGRPTPAVPVPVSPVPAPPAAEVDTGGVLWQVWSAIVEGVEHAVRPEAAAKVATTFGFPLVLMLAVLLFLVIQDLIDRRDPKLRAAPRTVTETLQKFRDEDEL